MSLSPEPLQCLGKATISPDAPDFLTGLELWREAGFTAALLLLPPCCPGIAALLFSPSLRLDGSAQAQLEAALLSQPEKIVVLCKLLFSGA